MKQAYDERVRGYVRDVLSHIPLTSPDRERIEEDLRAHLNERIEAGDPPIVAIAAMGDPKTVALSYLGDQELRYASLGRRFLAAFVDYWLLATVALFPVLLFIFAVMGHEGTTAMHSSHAMGDSTVTGSFGPIGYAMVPLVAVMLFVIAAVTSMIYYPVAEAIFGQTIGKWVMGLTVVTESGLAIGAKEAIIRRLPYIFQGLMFIDAIFIFLGHKHQRAFDHVAGTVVIQKR